MPAQFRIGDHVSWNSEAGRVRGVIRRKLTKPVKLKGYTVRASKEAPQYVIKSDKTDHVAIHKGSALRRLGGSLRRSRRRPASRESARVVSRSKSPARRRRGLSC